MLKTWFQNHPTAWAALGLVGLALYQWTQGDPAHAAQSVLAALAAMGLLQESQKPAV